MILDDALVVFGIVCLVAGVLGVLQAVEWWRLDRLDRQNREYVRCMERRWRRERGDHR